MGREYTSKYGSIMKQYQLQPLFVEEHGNVKKIQTNKGNFALKTIKNKVNTYFPNYIQMLLRQGFSRVVPIIPTVDGKFLVYHDNQYHYLMPWLKNKQNLDRNNVHENYFKELARLHTYTLQDNKINKNDVTAHYEGITREWDRRDKVLEAFVQECEKKWYMSPFELLFCTYFYETSLASKYARSQLETWYELMQEKKTARTVLTHGKTSTDHFLHDEKGKGYFANFEKASYATPINDLVGFFYRTLKTFPVLCDDCFNWFQTYRGHFSLRDDEIHLFLTYMTYPEPIFKVVDNYIRNKQKKSELEHVKLLQRAYWLNKNIEYFALKIVQEEQRKNEQSFSEEDPFIEEQPNSEEPLTDDQKEQKSHSD